MSKICLWLHPTTCTRSPWPFEDDRSIPVLSCLALTVGDILLTLFDLCCRLAAAHDAEQKRKQDERAKVGPQFVKGPAEQIKKPPYGLSTSGRQYFA